MIKGKNFLDIMICLCFDIQMLCFLVVVLEGNVYLRKLIDFNGHLE